MNEAGGYCAGEKQILYDITYMWNLKNTTSEYNKKEADSQIQRTNQWLPVEREGRGNTEVEEWEVQTTGYKIGSRMYYTTWGIQPIFCNNCKQKVTFKIVVKMCRKNKNNKKFKRKYAKQRKKGS